MFRQLLIREAAQEDRCSDAIENGEKEYLLSPAYFPVNA